MDGDIENQCSGPEDMHFCAPGDLTPLLLHRDCVVTVSHSQVSFSSKNMILPPEVLKSSEYASLGTMQCSDCFQSIQTFMKLTLLLPRINKGVWSKIEANRSRDAMQLFETYSGETGTTIKQGASGMYPVLNVLVNFLPSFRRNLIGSCCTLVELLPVKYGQTLHDIKITDNSGTYDSLPIAKSSEMEFQENVVPNMTLSSEY